MTEAASTSGCGSPSAPDWTFQPVDETLVLYYLLPMAAGYAVPDGACIIAGDPYSMEPWNLLAANPSMAAEGAYFFTQKVMLSTNGVRRKRTVSIADNKIVGTWRIQHSKNGGSNAGVRWCKTLLSYYNAADDSTTTGYVMHEYELYKDGCGGGGSELGHKGETHEWIICHVKVSDREISRRKRRMKESAIAAAKAAVASAEASAAAGAAAVAAAAAAFGGSIGSKKLMGEMGAKHFEVPDDGDSSYFL